MRNSEQLDEKKIEELFIKHYAKFVLFASKFTSSGLAEDIVQDVFLKLLKNTDQIRITESLKCYVYRAIKNRLQDHAKAKNVRLKHLDEVIARLRQEELDYYNPEKRQSLLLDEDEQALFAALEKLPPKCREIIKFRYLEGRKTSEISSDMGISVRTVETHIYKAIKQLRVAMRAVSLALPFLI